MKFLNMLKFISFLTLLALVYIHMQMQIIELAYEGKEKEKVIHKLVESNGNITYKILTLKSAYNLGDKLLTDDSDMRFVDPENIVQISTPREVLISENAAHNDVSQTKASSLLSLLSFGARAEAGSQK